MMGRPLMSVAMTLILTTPFMFFWTVGAKVFLVPALADDGATLGQLSFFSGAFVILWIGLLHGVDVLKGSIGIGISASSIALYLWTRRTIGPGHLYVALGGEVPGAVCESGPYRYLRHPFYLSYLVAFAAMMIAFPSKLSIAVGVLNGILFVYMAFDDERTLTKSPLGSAYAAYRDRVGWLFFLPLRRVKTFP
jgi:protein-S-isoprenylcysteine O-methyltransferase Ste14